GHLIVLQYEYGRNAQNGCEVDALMERGGLRRSISDPCQGHSRLVTLFEHKRDPCKNRNKCAHLAGGRNDAVHHAPYMKVLASARRVGRGEVLAEQVHYRNPHLMAGARITDHWAHFIDLFVKGMDIPYADSFLAGAEPRL